MLGFIIGILQATSVLSADCFKKDEAPVDFEFSNQNCRDLKGNIFSPGSELESCCGCFRL